MIFAQRPHGCWLTMKDDQSRVSLRYSLVICESKCPLREGRSRDGGKLMPQWYIKILLVRVVTGNTFKFRGSFKNRRFWYIRFKNLLF